MTSVTKVILAGVTAAFLSGPLQAEGDAVAGEKVFRKCKACHSLEPGKRMMGPSLAGIVGREAATVEGFKYSPAMAESGITWTEENLAGYLAAPRTFMPGNRMAFVGLRKEQEVADIIAYLKANAGE